MSEAFELVCSVADLPEVGGAPAVVGDIRMAIVRDEDGQVHAIDELCTHGAVSLAEGDVEGCEVECWLHGARFDLRSGQPQCPPAFAPVGVYAVRVMDENVYVDPTRRINA
ncbi:non-heme iron oxygenase ferredoxin subunit [Dermatophilus congolensis]|uniref:Biphenyl dioxygenase ferredoxin subunit n=1 Tax=Dermatophilus congolensis TaxID=1863 RepID=A0AA46BN67_9MICO|nr:non-heme iron oxygenase ferredoxin subunit [Dermatophilus congolensis]MBO3142901.1 non-heme iron oxygenase ferredoxin subunit [Dermatophilus congolensis]MBO3151892.1 non-heme iron oxygenase ferredoxin subunit [Dermatophilus congolensis]MBO3161102.1 non-heme iron oxygenase ferredoxin subunit [Dermatophilus congolensis]MBO3163174.1 non-heme iron oxygenase ferredoxin subunit [Dermatophilus congolensis]MBO3176731.1 non-heme iron oxygenase ferredoxin subunit [Dermatophilus congolensis]